MSSNQKTHVRWSMDQRTLAMISMIFLYIPIMIFLLGFTKFYIAAVTLAGIGYSFYRFWRVSGRNAAKAEEGSFRISGGTVWLCLGLCLLLCLFCGAGGIFNQAGDWHKANAVLRDLIEKTGRSIIKTVGKFLL